MIEFPLILIGYALLPLIAIQLMIMADRPQKTGEQTPFRRSRSCETAAVLSAVSRTAAFPGTFRIPAACHGIRPNRSSTSAGSPNEPSAIRIRR